MAEVFDCSDNSQLLAGMRTARQAIGRAGLVVIPTDTVYGIAGDAFSAAAVRKLLDAKGRTAQSPPPVLIANTDTLAALVTEVPGPVAALVEEFWPGGLTIVLRANPSLSWHLGETGGTVALRIPDHPLALEILQETGPLAVSSANRTGEPAARTVGEAQRMLGDSAAAYLDAGETGGTASTIVDATEVTEEGGTLRLLREGAISRAAIAELLPGVRIEEGVAPAPAEQPDAGEAGTEEPGAEEADAGA